MLTVYTPFFSLNGDQVKISYQCVHFTFHLIKMNFTLYMLEKWMKIICTGTKFNFKQVCKNWLRVKRSSCLPILLFLPSISVGTWTSHCSIESRGLPLYQSFLSPVNQCWDLGKSLFNRKQRSSSSPILPISRQSVLGLRQVNVH